MTILIYLLKLIGCSALFSGYYFLLLRNKQMHQYNRVYILISIVLSIVLPFIKIPLIMPAADSDQAFLSALNRIAFTGWEEEIILTAQSGLLASFVTAQHVFLFIYLTGLLMTGYPLLRSIMYIRCLSNKYEKKAYGDIQFYDTAEPGTPFSFLSMVFWNKDIPVESEKGEHMLRHEVFHIHQKHSYDIIFMEVACTILWFNPFCYLMKKELKVIHEFLADACAVLGKNKRQYAEFLVMQAVSHKKLSISNQFFYNQIKRRIAMILQQTTPGCAWFRKTMALPFVLLMFCACSLKSKDESMLRIPKKQSKDEINRVTNDEPAFTEAAYPGGAGAWMRFLNKTFKYPEEALDREIQGPVVVQFAVEKDGSISDIHAISGHDILSKEAVRLLKESGRWMPAQQNGQIVRSYKKQPVTFRLEVQ